MQQKMAEGTLRASQVWATQYDGNRKVGEGGISLAGEGGDVLLVTTQITIYITDQLLCRC